MKVRKIAEYLKRMTLKYLRFRMELEFLERLTLKNIKVRKIAKYLKPITLEYLRFGMTEILRANNAQEYKSKEGKSLNI